MKEPQYYSRLGRVDSTQGGNLPHWTQRCATFVTFRLGDSLPEGKLAQLQAEREEWLKAHPRYSNAVSLPPSTRRDAAFTCRRDVLVASDKDGATTFQTRQDAASTGCRVSDEDAEYRELFSERIQRWLDAGHGSCILRQAEMRQIVEDALRHFAAPMETRRRDVLVASDEDGDTTFQTRQDAASTSFTRQDAASTGAPDVRYSLYAYVVMPNHVHVLFMPHEGFDGRTIVQGWKSFTAKAINKALKRQGGIWQKESYDHLVRNVEEFNAIRAYIRGNNSQLAYDAYPR